MTPISAKVTAAAKSSGAAEAFRAALADRREARDFHGLFDVLLAQARWELKLPAIPLGNVQDTPENQRTAYEDRVVAAAKTVGAEFIAARDLASAYHYFRMIGETDALRSALDHWQLSPDDCADTAIGLALEQNLHPRRGLEWTLQRYGLCQAITVSEQLLAQGLRSPVREDCVKLLVKAIHGEIVERLAADVAGREPAPPRGAPIPTLLKGRDWLFADDQTHCDPSHLAAVVRFARFLPKGEELFLALQLCEYGQRLGPRHRGHEEPPFENLYADTAAYLKALAGLEFDAGLRRFQSKADGDASAAEVCVLLLRGAGREDDALKLAERRLNRPEFRPQLGTGLNEWLQRSGKFDAMAKFAAARGDLVGYLSGVAQGGSP